MRPQRRLHRAAREDAAVVGLVLQRDALAGARDEHLVLADHPEPAAQRSKSDRALRPAPPVWPSRLCDAVAPASAMPRPLAKLRPSSSAVPDGASTLVPMVHLQDLDVESAAERARRLFDEHGEQIHAEAHIARLDDGRVPRRGRDLRLVLGGTAGRADDMDDARLRRSPRP